MTDDCEAMRLLIQADADGELSPAEAAGMAAHVAGCAGCSGVQAQLAELSGRLRTAPYYRASGDLRARIRGLAAPPVVVPLMPKRRVRWPAPFGAGFALAACLALAVVLPHADNVADTVVAGHIRALQPGHLMDVVSTDQHTVKPWFDGRLDYAPPVRDFQAAGFPLTGGRLDYLDKRPVAALVYQHRQHEIDVFVWPDSTGSLSPSAGSRSGYNYQRWARDGMAFWAVSDLNADELAEFVKLWQG